MRSAALYTRVSTTGQAKDGTSLGSQAEKCRDYAKELGYNVIAEYKDDISGATLARPGLDSIRDHAERGEVDAVIVYDPDRLSRNLGHLMMLQQEFDNARVDLLFVNAPNDNTPEGMMLLQMRGMFGQYERAKITERSRRGKQTTARGGKVMLSWQEPYGYTYVQGEGRLEIDPQEGQWAKKIFEWYVLDGVSLRAIAMRLSELGVPTKRGAAKWSPSTIRSILQSPTYAGTWYFNKAGPAVAKKRRFADGRMPQREKSSSYQKPREQWIGVPVPAVISPELFEGVWPQMERNARHQKRNLKNEYLLRGLVLCADCGRRITAREYNGYTQYYCTGRYDPICREKCTCPWPNAAKLDADVWEKIAALMSNEELIMRTLKERQESRHAERQREDADMATIYSSEQSLKAEEARWLDAFGKGAIDVDQLQERMAIIRKQKEALQKTREELQDKIARHDQATAREASVRQLVKFARAGLPHVSFEEKRAFLEAMGVQGIIDGHSRKLVLTGFIDQTITLLLTEKERKGTEGDASDDGTFELSTKDKRALQRVAGPDHRDNRAFDRLPAKGSGNRESG